MTWVHDTLGEFGRQLGIEHLGFGSHGVAQLRLASGALIAVEPARRGEHDEVLVYLGRPVGHAAAGLVRRALAQAHFSHGGPWPVQVALRGDGPDAMLFALARMPERAFTPQALSAAVDFLGRWLDTAQSAR